MISYRYGTKGQEAYLETFSPGSRTIPIPEVEFTVPEHKKKFKHLQKLKFGQNHFIHWDTLGEISLADDVSELITVGVWDRLLSIRDPVHRDITLEFLASFSFDRSYADFDKEDTIHF